MEKNNWFNKYYNQHNIINNTDKYNDFIKFFKNNKKIDFKKEIEKKEHEYKMKLNKIKKNYKCKDYISNLKILKSLELIQEEFTIIKILSKYCLENNYLEYYFFIQSLEILKKISNILKDRLKQPTIYHDTNDLKNGIPRCSYKFCNFKDSCTYNYSKNLQICYSDHYVHNMISADLDILIKYIKLFYDNNNKNIILNKEILKSINTLCYVITHMENELKNRCFYLDKNEWELHHVTKKITDKIIRAKN